ncbi:MAG: ATP-binding protein [Burkholderiales bacterium]|nr:ATP-binding protein [Burkholderiales bacterium]
MRLKPSTCLPKSLAGRMTLILVIGLLAAQLASLYLHLQDRAGLMAAGYAHSAMPGMGAVPTRFLWHVGLTLVVVIGVSLIAVRWIARPLREMTEAATAFAHDIDAAPLEESGPDEVVRAAEAFNFMQKRLRQLVVERGHALAAVSHDLRTPLTRMRLRAELVDDPVLQQKLNADIDIMHSMVNSVLAYLRGLKDTEPAQPINMDALLHSIVEDERSLGRPVGLTERVPGDVAPPPYAGKLSVLRRAIGNLIDNAVAHGHRVTVSLHDTPDELRILVEDDGPGIPDADRVRATEPFVRLDTSRSLDTGGVGLGLAIVRDVAACHGGQLILENRSSGGLRAILVLGRPRA